MEQVPMPGEIPKEATEKAKPLEPEKAKEFLQDPKTLMDAMYLLLTSASSDPAKAKTEIELFLQDKQVNQNQEQWQGKIREIKEKHKQRFCQWKQEALARQHQEFATEGALEEETEKEGNLWCFHCINYPPSISENELIIEKPKTTSFHTSLNHVVRPVAAMGRGCSWSEKRFVVASKFSKVKELNGTPYGFLPEDTWWALGAIASLKLDPASTIVVAHKNEKDQKTLRELKESGARVFQADNPYQEAEKIIGDEGVQIILPANFKGAKRIADETGAFYGQHFGSLGGDASETYLYAEALVESEQDERVSETVDQLNQQDYPGNEAERYFLLIDLLGFGYFEPPGFHGFMANIVERPDRDQLLGELRRTTGTSFESPGAERIYDGLCRLAQEKDLQFPYFSPGEFKRRLDKIKDNLAIIPPNLIGDFLIKNFAKLG